ncbi:MAG: hypothetical protein ACD_50C00001G0002 [uncultured bacterium]|uniref:DUF2029 domain-containing protein n=1 Tax=Candidatus Gottesmanbacteria bacterium RIFCSPLOWO2_01_FULL_43_11b TaxID=1798392 RepID=A0A1F6AJH0_9BACT|nr:MAG: hypothetical protein ACD_50C00001G0002 [uncultured bacterium]OGG24407.1 MAG: hypothetical protein A3A79_04450 [Candidatus Gottesmanbacteria bacterium RIFCSPLOWO2_01_FULL_43_11b]
MIQIIASLLLFLYSYTQTDLNMTLSRVGILQAVQKVFQNIGYYQRPLSMWLYLGLLVILFAVYGKILAHIRNNKIDEKQFWRIVLVTSAILLFSYPAFSYDMFNYMFTAKTVVVYHQNPYEVIPLQFSDIDVWTNFMRWTHLPSAYTPFWIALTVPAYILGFGFLLTTMWSIKLLVLLFHLATIVGIGKILKRIEPKYKVLGMAIFAFNPLIIVEDLVSSHNDVVMMAFAVWAIVFFLEKKKLASWFALSLSVAAKLITAAIIPVWFFIGKKSWRNWILIFMVGGLLAVIATREVLPWYWVWIVPFIAILPSNSTLTSFSSAVSLGLLLRYAPFLYAGSWDPPALILKNIGTVLPIAVWTLIRFRRELWS